MNRIIASLCFILGFVLNLSAQSPSKYWVQFKDKQGTPFSINEPSKFLSPRAIELRQQHNIAIEENDLPANPFYIKQVMSLDTGMRFCTQSKWLNGITVYSEREDILEDIKKLPCVEFAEHTVTYKEPESRAVFDSLYKAEGPAFYTPLPGSEEGHTFNYGYATPQIMLNNIYWLHRMGFTGKNVRMMILDGGFANVDKTEAFEKLRADNRILGCRNIAEPDQNPLRVHTHGAMVLSCIAAYLPGKMIGTAPMVEVYLCQTEDARSETVVEEDNWVAGLELADSLGCQVMNSSLGYTGFPDSTQARTYKDLDGKTSRASRAATIAATKGMILCISAGNSGDYSWRYISTPADADDILTVGAVDFERDIAPFSSKGPTYDGRVKPDACAVGWNVLVVDEDGDLRISNGTSFSSPLLAGMTACLREAFPDASNYDIMQAIRESGDHFDKPNGDYGYGITDFFRAYNLLLQPKDSTLDFYFPSFVVKKDKIVVKVKSERPVTLTFNCLIRNSHKQWTKAVKLRSKKTVKLALPELPESLNYAIIDMKITTDDGRQFNFVTGTNNLRHSKKNK